MVTTCVFLVIAGKLTCFSVQGLYCCAINGDVPFYSTHSDSSAQSSPYILLTHAESLHIFDSYPILLQCMRIIETFNYKVLNVSTRRSQGRDYIIAHGIMRGTGSFLLPHTKRQLILVHELIEIGGLLSVLRVLSDIYSFLLDPNLINIALISAISIERLYGVLHTQRTPPSNENYSIEAGNTC